MRQLTAYILVLMLACSVAAGDESGVVQLQSGTRVEGEVTISGDTVRVENASGSHEFHRRLVKGIRRGGDRQSSTRDRSVRCRRIRRDMREAVVKVLQRKLSVDFAGAGVTEVVEYLQEITDGNFSYRPSELRALEPVTLHLEGVEVHQVLDLLADGRELQWGVQDDVIMLRGEIKPRTGIRVYDVRDLLLNVEDRTPTGTAILAEEGREDQDNRGQWGGEDGGDREFGRDNGDGDSRRGSQPLAGRAYDLGNLITSSVRPRSWDQPAVLMFGGQSNERD